MNVDNRLSHLKDIAQNARTTWIGLLGLLVFVGVTLMGHRDSDFFAYGAATTLPIVGIEVPPSAFFIAAPILIVALYCYLHLYLLGLWETLGDLQQIGDERRLGDLVYPTLFTIAGLLYRNMRRNDGCIFQRELASMTVVTALLLGWGFGISVLFGLWWRSMPAHDPIPTLISGTCLWLACGVGCRTLIGARHRLSQSNPEIKFSNRRRWYLFAALALVVFTSVSWARCKGGFEHLIENAWINSDFVARFIPLASADLTEAELTRKPKGWLPYDEWLKDYRARYAQRERIEKPFSQWANAVQFTFRNEARTRWISFTRSLDKVSLRGHDLRGAVMTNAFLAGADFRDSRLDGAAFDNAQLGGADFQRAKLKDANFDFAQMEHVNLGNAYLFFANMNGTKLDGADIDYAVLNEVSMLGVQLNEANLRQSMLIGVKIFSLKKEWAAGGKNSKKASMLGADFMNVSFVNAYLVPGVLKGASLRGADLKSLHKDAPLDQADFDVAFGDTRTELPPGITKPCHWDTKSIETYELDRKYLAWLENGAVPIPRNAEGVCP